MTIWIVKYYTELFNGVSTAVFSTLEKAREFTATDCDRMADDWSICEKQLDEPNARGKVYLKTNENTAKHS